jgi:hypothetical protein
MALRRIIGLAMGLALLAGGALDAAEIRFPEMAGWKLSEGIQTFGANTLYEYIDGAADLYLACEFEELNVAEYVDGKKAAVTVEAYRHRSSRDAFGIYSQERLPQANLLSIGAQATIDTNSVNFVQGRYYVKIGTFNTGNEDRAILQAFAARMSEMLGETGGLPALLSAFPAEGKKPNSEKYIVRNFLGYPFFHSAFTADYERSGAKFRLFLMEAADVNEGKEIVRQYLRQTKSPEETLREGRYTVSDPHHGVIDIYWRGRYIWGTVDLADGALRGEYLRLIDGKMQGKR